MKGVDTNVLVRYLAQDDKAQSALATRYIEKECSASDPCFVGHIVLCELAWVLESIYKQNREEIISVVESLLQVSHLVVMDQGLVWRALNDYKHSNVDFPDHLLARINESRGCDITVTFDKKAGKQSGFELLGA